MIQSLKTKTKMETLELKQIKKEITVAASQETAFEVFVNQMGLWWPAAGHTDDCPMVKIGLEAREGGRWYGFNSDGSERALGQVTTYQPHSLFVLDWQTDAKMVFQEDLHTEVRVEFIVEEPKKTKVKIRVNGQNSW